MSSITAVAFTKHADQDRRGQQSVRAKLAYLFADPTSLRALAQFLNNCADEMDRKDMKEPFHRHFRSTWKPWVPEMLDVVVERPSSYPKRLYRRKGIEKVNPGRIPQADL